MSVSNVIVIVFNAQGYGDDWTILLITNDGD